MRKVISTTLLLIGLSISAFAQKITVTGTVTDTNGEPIIGAVVYEKGTTNGVLTDVDGDYQIKCSEKATLVYSALSFKTKEENVNGRNEIDTALEEDNEWPTFPSCSVFLSQQTLPISKQLAK